MANSRHGILINKDTILERTQLHSNNNFSRLQSNLMQGISEVADKIGSVKSHIFASHNKDKEQQIDKILKFVEKSNDSRNEFAFASGLLNKEVLGNLNKKQLNAISDIVSKIDIYTTRLSALSLLGDNTYLINQTKEAVEIYKQAITEMSPYFEGVDISKAFGLNSVDTFWEIVDNEKPSKEDIELVNAFKLIGVNIRLNHQNEWQWVPATEKEAKQFGLPDLSFRFSKDEVDSLIDGYLNNPERQGRTITPEGLFKVYQERAEQVIESRNYTSTEKALMTTKLNEHYSRLLEGSDKEILELSSQEMIIKNAQKIAYTEIMQEQVSAINFGENIPAYSENLQRSIQGNELIKLDSNDRKNPLNKLLKNAVSAGDFVEDNINNNKIENIVDKYDSKIDRLKSMQKNILNGTPNPDKLEELQVQIEMLEQSKENLLDNVEFLKSYVTQALKDERLSGDKVREELKYSANNFEVKSNGEGLTVEAKHNGAGKVVPGTKAYEALSKAIKEKASRNNKTVSSESSYSVADILREFNNYEEFLDIAMSIEDGSDLGFANAMEAMGNLKLYEILFEKDAPLDRLFNDYKQKNPNSTINDFIDTQILDQELGSVNKETIVAGYEMALAKRGELENLSESSAQKIKGINSNYGKNIVLLDRAIKSFTPEELKKFQDPTYPSDAKQKLIKQKINEANAKGNINAVRGNKEFDEAMARHNNKTLQGLLAGDAQMSNDAEKELGLTEKGGISDYIKKYIEQLGEDQNKIDEKLNAKMKSESMKKPTMELYGSTSPSSVDQVKYEKKFKGYSGKELKKKFIKKILADMKTKLYFNKDLYNARINQGVNESTNKASNNNAEISPTKEELEQTPKEQEDNTSEENTSAKDVDKESQSTEKENQQISEHKIYRTTFDSTVFLPGMCIIEKAIDDMKGKVPSDKLDNITNLQTVFQCLTSVNNKENNPYSQKHMDGTDFRDACRMMAYQICKGELKDSQEVSNYLDMLVSKYSIPEDQKMVVGQLKKGFENLTPELMNYLLEFSSDFTTENNSDTKRTVNKIKLGKKLPKGLDDLTTDESRKEYIKTWMNENLKNYDLGAELLNMLVNDVYAEKGSSTGYERPVDMEFEI